MASVLSEVECRQCQYPNAYYEMDFRLKREYIFCPRCGYNYRLITLRNGKSRKFKLKNGCPLTRQIERKGFGVYSIQYINSSGIIGAFYSPIPDHVLAEFNQVMASPETDPDSSYLTNWNETANAVEIIHGTPKPI